MLVSSAFLVAGVRYATRPENVPLQNGLPSIALPAVFDPEFVPADRAKIPPEAFVFGYAHQGLAHAYALNLLDGHEIVNDTVGGEPIVATWCTLCNSAVVYSRVVAGRTLTFAVSSKLLRNAQIMVDRETGSLWTHATGEAIAGTYTGHHLKPLPGAIPHIRWRAWRSLYPQTLALSLHDEEDTPYDRYADYRTDKYRVGLYPPKESEMDTRLSPKEMVLGVTVGGKSKAYPYTLLERTPLVRDTVGGKEVLICRDSHSGATAVFAAPTASCDLEGRDIVTNTGLRWEAATGRPRRAHSPLPPLPHLCAYWFAWSGYHPDTELCIGVSSR